MVISRFGMLNLKIWQPCWFTRTSPKEFAENAPKPRIIITKLD
jgi:hypothetical protein